MYKPDPLLELCLPENTVPQLRPVWGGPVRLLNHGEIQELLRQKGWSGLRLWVMIPKVTDVVSREYICEVIRCSWNMRCHHHKVPLRFEK